MNCVSFMFKSVLTIVVGTHRHHGNLVVTVFNGALACKVRAHELVLCLREHFLLELFAADVEEPSYMP